MNTPEWKRIQHVSLTRPPGSHDEARAFYGGVLGLHEIEVPVSLREHDLIWYAVGPDEIHLVAQENADNTGSARHLCLQVSDLNVVRERLVLAGVEMWDATPIPGRPRLFCRDPFGNAIELTEIDDA